MMNSKVHELLNQQINKEFYSAYLYLQFSNYFEEAGLDGFANWYMIQAQEERDHAMLFYQYLKNENQKVSLEAIDKPEKKKGYICTICGYIHDGEELPEDFVCPICKHGKEDFEELK